MKKIKNFNFLYLSLSVLVLLIILFCLFNFIDFFSSNLTNVLIYFTSSIILALNSYKFAIKSKNKGIIVGIKIASILAIFIIILKLILKIKFTWWTLIIISAIYLITIFSSIYGANKKSSNV